MTLLAERTAYAAPFAQTNRRRIFVGNTKSSGVEWKSPLPNRALEHALAQCGNVAGASAESLTHLRWVLAQTLEDDMAYATLSSDGDGGAMAQWRAGRSYIALEIGVRECSFAYSDSEGNLRMNLEGVSALDRDAIRGALRAYTAHLNAANPQWRARRKANGR